MSSYRDPDYHLLCEEMQHKIELLERDRTAEYESSQAAMKKNRDLIRQLREDNRTLHRRLADVVADKESNSEAQQRKAMEKTKCLNAMKHTTLTYQRQLEELKNQYQRMKPKDTSGLLDDAMKLRDLENRLKKTQLKVSEVEDLNTYYMKVKRHLEEESVCFQSQLDNLEAEILKDRQELSNLEVMNQKAQLAKESVKTELQQQEERLSKERQEREKFIASYNRKMEERKAQAFRVEKRVPKTNLPGEEVSSQVRCRINSDEERKSSMLETFQQIKEATGVKDVQELLERFVTQKDTQDHLETMKEENVRVLLQLKEQRDQLSQQFEDIKYSGEAHFSRDQQLLEECEHKLLAQLQKSHAAKEQLDKLVRTHGTIRAGVKHVADKLQHISLSGDSLPEGSEGSEESVLELMVQCERKLKALQDELQTEDQAAILKEIEEQEFFIKVEEELPDYNTRVKLPDDDTEELRRGEDESEEEDANIVTREALKNQSQQIIESRSKKKHWAKKGKF
ncbi:outer dynein arm-docking complex subunit 3-like [Synchiropus splendidus]|uniref:outer dynein arm-docking complex subunit 3-like n=1 Tax=Synchiropus splendidus TaxID=270530 RepID=UPI00237DAEED|nr:outer dynein arm-docking complex subunit 3-like [Synchiropus splendidus]